MAEPKTEQEPSIEEILESIRQIISDDGEEGAAPGSQPAPATAAEDKKDKEGPPLTPPPAPTEPDVEMPLDLTPADAVSSSPGPDLSVKDQPAPVSFAAEDDILELTDKVAEPPPAAKPADLPGSTAMDQAMTTNEVSSDNSTAIISEPTATAATEALSKLLAGSLPVERKEGAHITLEDMARDMMKPLIKAWIDQNLPGLVEKIVQREVEKLSRRAADN